MKKITVELPDDYEIKIVKKEKQINSKFKKNDVIVSSTGLIAVFHSLGDECNGKYPVVYSVLYSPTEDSIKFKIDTGVGYEKDCEVANTEERNKLAKALIKDAIKNHNEKSKKVLKEVFNITSIVRNYQDLIDNEADIKGLYINLVSKIIEYTSVIQETDKSVAASEKVAKSMLAMAMISQLIPYYGGTITDEEWNDEDIIKYVIRRINNNVECDNIYCYYYFLAFHTKEQRDEFLKHNEQLVKDYLMID